MNLPQRANLVTGAPLQADQAQLIQSAQLQAAMNARRADPQAPQTMAAMDQIGQSVSNQLSQRELQASQLAMLAKDAVKAGPLQRGELPGTAGVLQMGNDPAGILARLGMTA